MKDSGKDTNKKEAKAKPSKASEKAEGELASVTNRAELKSFLTAVRDRLANRTAPPTHAASALQYVFNLPDVYDLLDKGNRELAREIWSRLKQAGVQLKDPPMLFAADDSGAEVG